MRALIFTGVLAVLGVGGYLLYRQLGPAPGSAPATAPQIEQAVARGADCTAARARYAFRGDPRLSLRFIDDPNMGENSVPHLLELSISAKQETHLFRVSVEGQPLYQRTLLTPVVNGVERRLGPGDRIQVSFFNDALEPISGAPHPRDAAPGYVFAPDMQRYIFNLGSDRRVDSPAGVFVFYACDPEPVSAPASQ